MEPSLKELEKMSTVGEVMDWCGVEGTDGVDTIKGSLLGVLGATPTTHPRLLGRLTPSNYSSYLEGWKIGSDKPTAVQHGQADLFGHVCRLIAGTVESNASGSKAAKPLSSTQPKARPSWSFPRKGCQILLAVLAAVCIVQRPWKIHPAEPLVDEVPPGFAPPGFRAVQMLAAVVCCLVDFIPAFCIGLLCLWSWAGLPGIETEGSQVTQKVRRIMWISWASSCAMALDGSRTAQLAAMIHLPTVMVLGMSRCLNGVVALRTRKLMSLAVPMGLSYLMHWWWAKLVQLPEEAKANALQKLHKVYAERCFNVAVEFGGIWIKQGQKISGAPLGLPVEYQDQLKKCTNAVPPRSTEAIKECIAKSYGKSPDSVFKTFDPKPVGAASIGQVHRATLMDGREVVVKVQYPEVADTLNFDLWIMTLAMKLVTLIQGGSHEKMMNEFKRVMLEELDFMNEVKNMDRIHCNLSGPFPQVNVPKPVNQLCTSTVLVMTIVPGVSLMDAALRMVQVLAKFCGMGDMKTEDMLQEVMKDRTQDKGKPSDKVQDKAQERLKQLALDLYTRIPEEHKAEAVEKMFTAGRAVARFGSVMYNNSAAVKLFGYKPLEPVPAFDMSKVSQTIWDAFGHQVFIDGFCSADSHPGNILVEVDTGAVGLIDFGNAVEIPIGVRVRLARLLIAIAEGSDVEMAQALAQFGARTPNMGTKNFAIMAKTYFGDVGFSEDMLEQMMKTQEEEGGDLSYEDDKAMMVIVAISMIRISSMCLGTAKAHYPAVAWTGLARQTIEKYGSQYPVGNPIDMDLKSASR